jgi:Tol biopolymer transport system component
VSIDGGTPVPMFRQESWRPTISPDGKWVAFGTHGVLQLASLTGAAPVRTFKDANPTTYCMMRWTEDGSGLLHNCGPNDRKNVWLQPIDGSPPRQMTHFDDEYVLYFDVVPGGNELVVVRGILARDAVLIKNFR